LHFWKYQNKVRSVTTRLLNRKKLENIYKFQFTMLDSEKEKEKKPKSTLFIQLYPQHRSWEWDNYIENKLKKTNEA